MRGLDWLYSLQSFGVKLGLDNMRRLLATIKAPSPPPVTIHVAGTNGKGSVCAFIESIARTHGLRTGLFTSPHLVRFHERMRVSGELIPDSVLQHLLDRFQDTVSSWDPHPSFFEVTLALAMAYFYEEQVECLILETGLGGRLDATNAVEPRHVSVITPIHYDHTQILGETLEAIAREKAGIFRSGVPALCAPQLPEAEIALRQAASAVQAPIAFVQRAYAGEVGIPGEHQHANAALAAAAFHVAGFEASAKCVAEGIRVTSWPGRFQEIGRYTIDGAHNTASVEALYATWRQVHGKTKATVIYGCAQDKPTEDSLALLEEMAARFVFTPINSGRSESPDTLKALVEKAAQSAENLEQALALAEGHAELILITGSLFLAGEAIALLTAEDSPRTTNQ